MDFATLLGLVIAIAAIGGSYALEGGTIDSVFLTAPILIVVGGTLGATIVTSSMSTVSQVPTLLRLAFSERIANHDRTIDLLVRLAERARRDGILGLEKELARINDKFLRKALQLAIDGTEADTLRSILETEIAYMEERHNRGIAFFRKAGGFSPTMGIIGTVLGLVHTLGNTNNAARMATAIAGAFIATLWGVALANVFFLPIADKLRLRHDEEIAHLELLMEGTLAIQAGDNPRSVRERLMSFMAPHQRLAA
jgi:chemotaxis protein MotA